MKDNKTNKGAKAPVSKSPDQIVTEGLNKIDLSAGEKAGFRIDRWVIKCADVCLFTCRAGEETGYGVGIVAAKVGEGLDEDRLRFRKLPVAEWLKHAHLISSTLFDRFTQCYKTEAAAAARVKEFCGKFDGKIAVGATAAGYSDATEGEGDSGEGRVARTRPEVVKALVEKWLNLKRETVTPSAALDDVLAGVLAAVTQVEALEEVEAAREAVARVRSKRAAKAK